MALVNIGFLFATIGIVFVLLNLVKVLERIAVALELANRKQESVVAPVAPVVAPVAPVAAPVAVATPTETTIHPGMSDEKLFAILAVAAMNTLGPGAQIIKFRPASTYDWQWTQQGRAGLHNRKV